MIHRLIIVSMCITFASCMKMQGAKSIENFTHDHSLEFIALFLIDTWHDEANGEYSLRFRNNSGIVHQYGLFITSQCESANPNEHYIFDPVGPGVLSKREIMTNPRNFFIGVNDKCIITWEGILYGNRFIEGTRRDPRFYTCTVNMDDGSDIACDSNY